MAASFSGGLFNGPTNPGLAHADSIAQPTSASFNSGFSIVGTIRPRPNPSSSSGNFFSHDTSFGSLSLVGFQFGVIYSDMLLTVQIRDSDDNRLLARSLPNSLTEDVWQAVAVIWDGNITGGIQLYIGGAPVTTNITPLGVFGGLNGGSQPIRIGAGFAASSGELRGYSGEVDCLSLWNGAVNANQTGGACTPAPEPSSILLLTSALFGLGASTALRRRGRP